MSILNNEIEKLEALVRPNIRVLKPYSSARDEFNLTSTVHCPPSTVYRPSSTVPRIFLDANENSLGGPLDTDYSRYPDPRQQALKARLAQREGLAPEQVFLGNGSDEAIDLLLRAYCTPGRDTIVLLPPTYGMYAVLANIHGAGIRLAPLQPGFLPDMAAVRNATEAHAKIIFLCSPNNPTGNHLPEDFIRETLLNFPGLVVVDEAYGDFAGRPSMTNWLAEFPNLVVLKTFSKAWGLAGLRVGMAFAHPYVIATLDKIKYPYNLSTPALQLALQALDGETVVRDKIGVLQDERRRLVEALLPLSLVVTIYPSDANFLLVQVSDAIGIYRYLCENGVVVRDRSRELHCENCLRITVGAPEENDRLLDLLQQLDKTNITI